MIQVYVDLINGNKINPTTGQVWTINDVPECYREEVQRRLNNE